MTCIQTFNKKLVYEYSKCIGEEVRGKGGNVLLGPMINIARIPLSGRNFETFGEDPYLCGEMV